MTDFTYDPASHYDRVTAAWRWIMGEELHYGVFETGHDDLPTATGRLTKRLIEAADVEDGHALLDVGCGTGAPACQLGRLGARVTGITTSQAGVEAATALAVSSGVDDRVTFELRDGMSNGFPDQSFDRVWVLESSHLMRDRGLLIAECARVLRPGGRIGLCDIMLQREMELQEVMRLRRPFELLRGVFGDARMELLSTYVDLFAQSGLMVDISDDLTRTTQPTFGLWIDNAERHRDKILPLLGHDGLQQFVEAARVLDGFWQDGTLGYGLIAGRRS